MYGCWKLIVVTERDNFDFNSQVPVSYIYRSRPLSSLCLHMFKHLNVLRRQQVNAGWKVIYVSSKSHG